MRVENTVHQSPDQHKNQALIQPRRETGDSAMRRGTEARRETEKELNRPLLDRLAEEEKKAGKTEKQLTVAEREECELEKLQEAVRRMNDRAANNHITLRFRLHEEANRWMVQVVDVVEEEVLKVIPPEELLDLVGRIHELAGLLVDTRR
jgi:flagellar protein FlaG